MEVPGNEIGGCRADLTKIGVIAPSPDISDNKVLFFRISSAFFKTSTSSCSRWRVLSNSWFSRRSASAHSASAAFSARNVSNAASVTGSSGFCISSLLSPANSFSCFFFRPPLFLSTPGSFPETWTFVGGSAPNRWGNPRVILPFEEEGQCGREVSWPFATQARQGPKAVVCTDATHPSSARHSGSHGQTGVELLGAQ